MLLEYGHLTLEQMDNHITLSTIYTTTSTKVLMKRMKVKRVRV